MAKPPPPGGSPASSATWPLIIVKGPWDDRDIRFQARHIVFTKVHNAGFNCIAAQVLVMPEKWERSDALLATAVREIAFQTPPLRSLLPRRRPASAGDRRQPWHCRDHRQPAGGNSAPHPGHRAGQQGRRGEFASARYFVSALMATTEVPEASPPSSSCATR